MRVRVKWSLKNPYWSIGGGWIVTDCTGVFPPYITHSIVLLNCKLHSPSLGVIEGDVCTDSTRHLSEGITPIGFVNDDGAIRYEAECVFLTVYDGMADAYASVPEDA